jgi:hypothetical protein
MSGRASTTFLLHLADRMISRHDFRSPMGVAGVGSAVYGNSGISFGQPHWGRMTIKPASRSPSTRCSVQTLA